MAQNRRPSEISTNSNTESQADQIERHRQEVNNRIELNQQGIAGWNARWERMQEDRGNRARFVESRLLFENQKIEQTKEKKGRRSTLPWKLPSIGGSWVFGPSRESKMEEVKKWEDKKHQDTNNQQHHTESNWLPFGKKKDYKESRAEVAARLQREDMERKRRREAEWEKEKAIIQERKLNQAEYLASENLMKALILEEEMIKQARTIHDKSATYMPKIKSSTGVIPEINEHIEETENHYSSISSSKSDYTGKEIKHTSEKTYSEISGDWNGPVTLFAGFEKEEIKEQELQIRHNSSNIFQKYELQLEERKGESNMTRPLFVTSTPVKQKPAVRNSKTGSKDSELLTTPNSEKRHKNLQCHWPERK